MADIKVLDKDQLAQLWTKMNNTFMQKGGLEPNSVVNNLYHLGAYDSYVDNNDGTTTITRQTGYITKDDFRYDSGLNIWRATVPLDLRNDNFVSNVDIPYQYAWEGGYNHYYYESGWTNFFVLSANLSGIIIQYKLASSYIEKAIRNQPLNTLNASGSAWLQNEYNKTLNLCPSPLIQGYIQNTTNSYVYSSTRIGSNTFKVKAGTYTLSFSTSLTDVKPYVYSTTNTSYEATTSAGTKQLTFTLSSDSEILLLFIRTPENTLSVNNITNVMVNEGSIALPYFAYDGGKIAHRGDIEPVLLWANGSPNSSFATQNITLSQAITNFKYFIVEVSLQASSGQGNMLFKFRAKTSNNNYLTVFDNGSSATHSTRAFTVTSATNINISNCSNGNGNCIPLAIYGTNVL